MVVGVDGWELCACNMHVGEYGLVCCKWICLGRKENDWVYRCVCSMYDCSVGNCSGDMPVWEWVLLFL